MSDRPIIILATRCDELAVPHSPSHKEPCYDCERECWVSRVTLGDVSGEYLVMCGDCVLVRGDELPKEIYVGPHTLDAAIETFEEEIRKGKN